MSHIVTIRTEVRDPVAIRMACTRLNLSEPVFGEFRIYNNLATGWNVQLPGWKFPVVCDTNSANITFDNFEGNWGDRQHLNRFLQRYAVEKAKLEARRRGHTVAEQLLSDGSVKLTISLGGVA